MILKQRAFWMLGLLGAVSACAAPLLFDKPGMAPGSGKGDLTDCQVEALAKVPPSNRINTIPGGPETTYVNCASGFCTANTYGGGSTTYTVDVNAPLRRDVLIQCMQKKGYTLRQSRKQS